MVYEGWLINLLNDAISPFHKGAKEQRALEIPFAPLLLCVKYS